MTKQVYKQQKRCLQGVFKMPQENELLKLRFKLKTGEEFEAQGNLNFISTQKEAFLNLLKTPKVLQNSLSNYKTEESAQDTPKLLARPTYFRNIQPKTSFPTPSSEVWNKVAYSDGENIIIRRKSKLIKPQIAALIILGANKIINAQSTLSALELAKSLKLSGYLKTGERLDRIITTEIKEGHLSFEGSKRNRLYRITATGQAKAYTWAEKLLQEF